MITDPFENTLAIAWLPLDDCFRVHVMGISAFNTALGIDCFPIVDRFSIRAARRIKSIKPEVLA
jgi:hypothetical protein